MPKRDAKGRLRYSREELMALYTQRKREYESHNLENHPEYHKIIKWLKEHKNER